jgi:hypothetical protein
MFAGLCEVRLTPAGVNVVLLVTMTLGGKVVVFGMTRRACNNHTGRGDTSSNELVKGTYAAAELVLAGLCAVLLLSMLVSCW